MGLKLKLSMALAGVLVIGVLASRGCDETPLPPILHVNMEGTRFELPREYITSWARGMGQDNAEWDGLDIEASWPSMEAFKDPDPDGDVAVRYANTLSIAVRPLGPFGAQNRPGALRDMVDWSLHRSRHGYEGRSNLFGLLRFSEIVKAGDPPGAGLDDVLVYPSVEAPQVWIECSPEQGGKYSVPNPGCEEDFYPPNLPVRIEVYYQLKHLEEWEGIQLKVAALITSFAQE